MADFFSHGLLGAGVSSAIARILRAPLWVVIVACVYGLVLGAWPDAADYVSSLFGWTQPGELYTLYHSSPPWLLIIQPPFFLHWALDKFVFHIVPGADWWNSLGWVNILMLTAAALCFWFAYPKGEK